MQRIRHTIRTTILYVSSVVLITGIPMAAFADKSDACVAAKHTGSKWVTDPATGTCVKASTIVASPSPSPTPTTTPTPDPTTSPTPAPTTSNPSTTTVDPNASTIDAKGNNSTTTDNSNTGATSNTSDTTKTDVNNAVQSDSGSGNADVTGNVSSGNAGTGNADTTATVVNSVNSSDNANQGVATFTYDVNGNVVGDITIDGTGAPVDANSTTSVTNNKHVKNNTNLTNNVDVNAKSGDAKVHGNGSNGNSTTGNANAMVDITNLINTIIAANQSFVGTINIYGNLNGDILLSPEFIPQLLAANDGSTSSNSMTNITDTSTITDSATIINNINLAANSGNAGVTGNGSNGNATTGSTQTNLTILNLTGHNVNAANSLLVFVNVLGTWVGMIVDAPGATAAALGSGVTENNTTNIANNSDINNAGNITNNVTVGAQSGNANVIGNGSTGSATSGNATASANIANFNTSTFNLTGWFGILYINVFGSWIGSFGINTDAGTITPISGPAVQQQAAQQSTTTTVSSPAIRFGFVPKSDGFGQSQGGTDSTSDTSPTGTIDQTSRIAAAEQQTSAPTTISLKDQHGYPFSIVGIAGFLVAGAGSTMTFWRRKK